ncbi:formate/nitrite transporter family protein [Paenibacillus camelliae]|uniref:formate/nitrite transporter family protein n=1 Tax=Paenibacillus camelliae TaxID=512410 RepID=UPI002041D0DC|nr:formate/nitrite transporter family protein [Paenibacillus camelliae]MCM3634750.1 formate/nitrite transporter family protein [Paenibacillus camelliae]
MSYVKPIEVLETMVINGANKANATPLQMLIRGGLGGAILACATTLAFTATAQTGLGLVGALVFPVGFVIIVLLGLELVTGNFALIPLSVLEKKTTSAAMLRNWFYVIIGHLLGCAVYALLYWVSITSIGSNTEHPMIANIISISEAKTLSYKALGMEGLVLVFVKAILCNWMVTLGVVMGLTSKSTIGKITAMWLPILIFFAQGFEHAVVNMFVIPMGMMFGANVSMGDWWIWNQIPVLAGNLIGSVLFTALFLYLSHKPLPSFSQLQPKASETVQEKS